MCRDMPPLELAIQFHGHICPELLLGVRVAEFALSQLGVGPNQDEDLAAIVETDSGSVDAIQAILGCTFGKGNLYFRDYGKSVFTIVSRSQPRALRIAQKFGVLDNPAVERFQALQAKEQLCSEEEGERESLMAEVFEWIMSQPFETFFHWQEAEFPYLEKAQIQKSVQCQQCGEGVRQSRAMITDQGLLCPACRLAQGGEAADV